MPDISKDLCVGCEECVAYCPMGAISVSDGIAQVDMDQCVECGVCFQNDICPTGAISDSRPEWPRAVRAVFSNPLITHAATGVTGRGTEEMKTNDVTGRFREGMVGLGVEMGRPGTGARFSDVQKVAMALAEVEGVVFEEKNPVTALMVDGSGRIREDVLAEKVLSAIIEISFPLQKTAEVLRALKKVEPEVSTVFSVCLISRVYPDGSVPPLDVCREMGIYVSPNCKTNMGLGRRRRSGGEEK